MRNWKSEWAEQEVASNGEEAGMDDDDDMEEVPIFWAD
jgi:hypothetical protein